MSSKNKKGLREQTFFVALLALPYHGLEADESLRRQVMNGKQNHLLNSLFMPRK